MPTCLVRIIPVWLLALCLFAPFQVISEEWDGLFRLGAFLPTSQETRELYRPAWKQYQLEVSYNFSCTWSLWANIAYSIIDGRPIDSRLQLYPIGLGVLYRVGLSKCLEGYLGAGPTFSFLHLDNDLEVENHERDPFKVSKREFGGIIKSGLRYHYHEAIFVELFADYYYTQFHVEADHLFKRDRLDLSAFFIGAGIGASF